MYFWALWKKKHERWLWIYMSHVIHAIRIYAYVKILMTTVGMPNNKQDVVHSYYYKWEEGRSRISNPSFIIKGFVKVEKEEEKNICTNTLYYTSKYFLVSICLRSGGFTCLNHSNYDWVCFWIFYFVISFKCTHIDLN